MGRYCFVEKCNTSKYKRQHEDNDTSLRFFGFPSNPVLKEKWIEALVTLNKQESARNLPKSSRICILHFTEDCIECFGYQQLRLKPDSVPSIFPYLQEQRMEILPADVDAPQMKSSSTDVINNPCSTESIEHIEADGMTEISINNQDLDPSSETEMEIETSLVDNTSTILKNTIRYPGDIGAEVLNKFTPSVQMKYIKLLKHACEKKNKTINRLRVQQLPQKRKIASLQELLTELRQKYELSENTSEIVQVKNCNNYK